MAEVSATTRTKNLVAFHSKTVVLNCRDNPGDERLGETGPAGAGLEFRVAGEQRCVAARAMKDAAAMFG